MDSQIIKCIIVDDERLFRDYLKEAVDWRNHGFVISGEAENGIQALTLANKQSPDVMFIDIDMPHMDGLSLIGELQQQKRNIQYILITGFGDFKYTHRAIQLGVFDYLRKPFDEDELTACLLKICPRSRSEPEKAPNNSCCNR